MSTRKAHAWRQAAFAGRPPGSHFPTPKEGVANQKCHTQQGLLEGTHAVDVSIYIYIYRYIDIYIYRQIQSSTCCQKVSRTICKSSCCTNGRFAEAFAWTDGISTGVIYIYICTYTSPVILKPSFPTVQVSSLPAIIYIYTQRCCSKQNCNLLVAVITRDGLLAAPPSKVNSH